MARQPAIVHWTEIEGTQPHWYAGSQEPMACGADFCRHFGFSKIGIHHERLLPGRRLSRPHAESAEKDFVYVISGAPGVWLDESLHRLAAGDAVGFRRVKVSLIRSSTTLTSKFTCSLWGRRQSLRTRSSIPSTGNAASAQ